MAEKKPFRAGSVRPVPGASARSYEMTLEMSTPDGETRNLIPWCTSIAMPMEYDSSTMPYLAARVAVDRDTLIMMRQRWRELMFVVGGGHRIKTGRHEGDSTVEWFPRTEHLMLDMDESTPPAEERTEADGRTGGLVPTYGVELILFAKRHLEAGRKVVNKVYCGATMEEVVTALAGAAGAGRPLIGKPDNPLRHENVLVPPCTFAQSLAWLQDWYGLWADGFRMFLDQTHCVVMGKNQFLPREGHRAVSVFQVLDPSQRDGMFAEPSLEREDSEVYETRILAENVRVVQDDGFSRELDGQTVRASGATADDVSSVLRGTGGAGLTGRGREAKDRPMWFRASGGMAFNARMRSVNERAETVTLTSRSHLVDAFAMERKARLEFVGSEAGRWIGDYRFSSVTHALVKDLSDQEFDIATRAELVRI